jgi:hypothetical protein
MIRMKKWTLRALMTRLTASQEAPLKPFSHKYRYGLTCDTSPGSPLADSRQEAQVTGSAQEKGTEYAAIQGDTLAGSMPQALLGTGTHAA